jgi:hypothetical protein
MNPNETRFSFLRDSVQTKFLSLNSILREGFKLIPIVACAVALAPAGFAASVPLIYQGSFLEGAPGIDQGLPIFLSGSPNNVRLKYFVPDFASLVSINSIDVSVNVYDDGDANNGEEGAILFVLNGVGLPNLTLQTFSGLNGYTETSPLTVSGSVGAGDLSDALLEIQEDGIFFIRVNRDGNDFYVKGASVAIDGTLGSVPDASSTLPLLAAGLALIAIFRRRIAGASARG